MRKQELIRELLRMPNADLKQLSKYFGLPVTKQTGGYRSKDEMVWNLVGGATPDALRAASNRLRHTAARVSMDLVESANKVERERERKIEQLNEEWKKKQAVAAHKRRLIKESNEWDRDRDREIHKDNINNQLQGHHSDRNARSNQMANNASTTKAARIQKMIQERIVSERGDATDQLYSNASTESKENYRSCLRLAGASHMDRSALKFHPCGDHLRQ